MKAEANIVSASVTQCNIKTKLVKPRLHDDDDGDDSDEEESKEVPPVLLLDTI